MTNKSCFLTGRLLTVVFVLFLGACQSIIQKPVSKKSKPRPQVIVERSDSGKFKIRISKAAGQLSEAEVRQIVARYIGDPRGGYHAQGNAYRGPNGVASLGSTNAYSSFLAPDESDISKNYRPLHQSYALSLTLDSVSCDTEADELLCAVTQSDGWNFGGAFDFFFSKWLGVSVGATYRSSDLNTPLNLGEYSINKSSYALDYNILVKPRYTIHTNSLSQMGIDGIMLDAGAGFTVRNINTEVDNNSSEESGEGSITTPNFKFTAGIRVILRSRLFAGASYSLDTSASDYEVCISAGDFDDCIDQNEVGLADLPGRSSFGLNVGYLF